MERISLKFHSKLLENGRIGKGFTIIELMIVIAIIAILAVVLIPKGGIAKDKARNTGKIVDKRTLQGYIDYKWENILDTCNGDKSLADNKLLEYLANDVEIKNMVSPMNKNIRGLHDKVVSDNTSTDNYINIVDSKCKDTLMYKDRLYIKDGKVLEGNFSEEVITRNYSILAEALKDLKDSSWHQGEHRLFRRNFLEKMSKYGELVNPYNPSEKGLSIVVSCEDPWELGEHYIKSVYYRNKDYIWKEKGVITIREGIDDVYVGTGDGYEKLDLRRYLNK